MPVPIAIFLVAMMLPTTVWLNHRRLRLPTYRVVLIVTILPILVALISGRKGRMHVVDLLVLAHCGWAMPGLVKWTGVAQEMVPGGIYFVEFAGAYTLCRRYIRSDEDFAAVARTYVALAVATLVLTIHEALTDIHN